MESNPQTVYIQYNDSCPTPERDFMPHQQAPSPVRHLSSVALPDAVATCAMLSLSGQEYRISAAEEMARTLDYTGVSSDVELLVEFLADSQQHYSRTSMPARSIVTAGAIVRAHACEGCAGDASPPSVGLHARVIIEIGDMNDARYAESDVSDAGDAALSVVDESTSSPPSILSRAYGYLKIIPCYIWMFLASSLSSFGHALLSLSNYPMTSSFVVCAIFIFGLHASGIVSDTPAGFCVDPQRQSYSLSSSLVREVAPGADQRDYTSIDFPAFPALAVQSCALSQLEANSAASSELALNVNHAELAVTDTASMVKTSRHPSRKGSLARAPESYASEARIVGRLLYYLSVELGGAVDNILASDECAVRALAAPQEAIELRSATAMMLCSAMHLLASEVANELSDASIFAAVLDALEAKLSGLRVVNENDSMSTGSTVDWTKLGSRQGVSNSLTVSKCRTASIPANVVPLLASRRPAVYPSILRSRAPDEALWGRLLLLRAWLQAATATALEVMRMCSSGGARQTCYTEIEPLLLLMRSPLSFVIVAQWYSYRVDPSWSARRMRRAVCGKLSKQVGRQIARLAHGSLLASPAGLSFSATTGEHRTRPSILSEAGNVRRQRPRLFRKQAAVVDERTVILVRHGLRGSRAETLAQIAISHSSAHFKGTSFALRSPAHQLSRTVSLLELAENAGIVAPSLAGGSAREDRSTPLTAPFQNDGRLETLSRSSRVPSQT
ncbi:hypothetical protein L226DRAFT_524723 [Lentinus tigrinus ALCF2SS1-7]|uniref:uncharacterized protein n=1 Tax=Lentinus tigrinus ALCF2SS1-7 TaxID=1328758 RepID=UPI001165DE64|nr:hypothetical protein L226DRAFT_524723 [Lentinus tigrinus ALCF2SS1-7]